MLLFGIAVSLPLSAGAASPQTDTDGPPTTLVQALAEAYANNATLQEQRASLRATDEGVPTAMSGWRPTVTLSGSFGHSSSTVKQNTQQ
ncbi:MAG: hypothetical protein B7Z77_03975, partial [Acidocella sp. 20-58-15]